MSTDLKRIKAAWMEGDRVEAFTLYLMASYPETWMRYVSDVPKFSDKLDALTTIAVFPDLLIELVRQKIIPASTPRNKSISNP